MAKPKPKRIPSDDCEIMIDGDLCRPHEGEWVELIAHETVGELAMRVKFARLQADAAGLVGEPDEGRRLNVLYDAHYQELIGFLAERVFAWDWTDLRGRPLPQPADEEGRPLGLCRLRAAELYWLLNATGGESEAERKNA